MKSEFSIPYLVGDTLTILIAQADFSAMLFNNDEMEIVEFRFEFDNGPLVSATWFEEEDLEPLAQLLRDSGLDTDGQPISLDDQEDYPSGAVWQTTFYGNSSLNVLKSRPEVLRLKLLVEALIPMTAFESRLKHFLVTSLELIHSTSACRHSFTDDDEWFDKECLRCSLKVWDPEALALLTEDWI